VRKKGYRNYLGSERVYRTRKKKEKIPRGTLQPFRVSRQPDQLPRKNKRVNSPGGGGVKDRVAASSIPAVKGEKLLHQRNREESLRSYVSDCKKKEKRL